LLEINIEKDKIVSRHQCGETQRDLRVNIKFSLYVKTDTHGYAWENIRLIVRWIERLKVRKCGGEKIKGRQCNVQFL